MTSQLASLGSPVAAYAESPAAFSPSARSAAPVPEELRASLAGAARSPEITQAYIEELKARAEERAANSRAIRTRMQLEGQAAEASIVMVTAVTSSDGGEATVEASTGSVSVAVAQAAYRSDGV
ncbi:hypothetical protein E3C22_21335 [Jiella endophytica]|uniref:Uncharacterized protein n=1 Tax=Jiella endophytica TaxID=2558362 RepID=A0A4Y8RC87_9HYPH|nr:hypothetical protein [Jiella endophytica]TFF18766.1 hypothetical protein E3C22_21335 [Jiella endophytica]